MTSRRIPHDMKAGTLHYSNNWGDFIITCYLNNKKVCILFLETKNEYIVRKDHIIDNSISDTKELLNLKSKNLTQKRLKKFYSYNKDTGCFVRKIQITNSKKISIKKHSNEGYLILCVDGRYYKAHILAWLYVTGEFPLNEIDHINHITRDNRFTNLRDVTHKENMMNLSKNIFNTTGITGVYFKKSKWISRISLHGKNIHLGSFNNKNDATIARKMAEYEYGFHANHGENI